MKTVTEKTSSIRELLEQEARAWRELPSRDYDRAVSAMLDDAGPDALLPLIRATLRRNDPLLTDSRVSGTEHLLTKLAADRNTAASAAPTLVLIAWLQLGAAAQRGPTSINISARLPPGIALPEGVEPASITDPLLRQQALEAAEGHREEAGRWNAKQRAIGGLARLAAILQKSTFATRHPEAARDLALAMSLAPGLPRELQESLRSFGGGVK